MADQKQTNTTSTPRISDGLDALLGPETAISKKIRAALEKFETEELRPAIGDAMDQIRSSFERVEDMTSFRDRSDKRYREGIPRALHRRESEMITATSKALREVYAQKMREFLARGQQGLDEEAFLKAFKQENKAALNALKGESAAHLTALGKFVDSIAGDRNVTIAELAQFSFVSKNLSGAVNKSMSTEHKALKEKVADKTKKLVKKDYLALIDVIDRGGAVTADQALDAQLGKSRDNHIGGVFLNMLTSEQKVALIKTWINEGPQAKGNVGEFIIAMVTSGVLRPDGDTEALLKDAAEKGAITQQAFATYSGQLRDGTLQRKRAKFKAQIEKINKSSFEKKDHHGAADILQLANLIWGRIGEWGALTALANLIFNINDPEAILSNKYIPMGLGVAVASWEKVTGDRHSGELLGGFGRGEGTQMVAGPSEGERKNKALLDSANHIDELVLSDYNLGPLLLESGHARRTFVELMKTKKPGETLKTEEWSKELKTKDEKKWLRQFQEAHQEPDTYLTTVANVLVRTGLNKPNAIGRFLVELKGKGAEAALAKIPHQNA